MKSKICAVVVTYNRKELLLRNIKATLSQTVSVDILIFDNHSTDGTELYLRENGVLDLDNVHYFYNSVNSGGAGGFCEGMKKAVQMGAELIWLMDDDGYCYNADTLNALVSAIPDDSADFILNATVVCNDDLDLTFGFIGIDSYSELKQSAKGNNYDGYINPFNGTLISKGCVERIGFPHGEFFIYGDEHEYMLRALKNNILVRTVVDALYFHPVNRDIKYKHIWRYDVPIKDEPVWKMFCDTRNAIFITNEYENKKMLLIRIFIAIAAAFQKETKKITYIKYTLLGIYDGLRSNFNRPIMFNK